MAWALISSFELVLGDSDTVTLQHPRFPNWGVEGTVSAL